MFFARIEGLFQQNLPLIWNLQRRRNVWVFDFLSFLAAAINMYI